MNRFGLFPDDPLAPVVSEVAAEAASVREMGGRLEALAGEVKAALEKGRLADPEAVERLEQAAAKGADRRAADLARAHNLRTVLVAVALLAGCVGAGVAAGYR